MDSEDYLDLFSGKEETGRIFTLLFNSSNLISSTYAAAIVLGISFGIAALAALAYYALIGGFDSDGGYGSSSYSSYFQSKEINIHYRMGRIDKKSHQYRYNIYQIRK